MKKIISLNESDLVKLIKKIIYESSIPNTTPEWVNKNSTYFSVISNTRELHFIPASDSKKFDCWIVDKGMSTADLIGTTPLINEITVSLDNSLKPVLVGGKSETANKIYNSTFNTQIPNGIVFVRNDEPVISKIKFRQIEEDIVRTWEKIDKNGGTMGFGKEYFSYKNQPYTLGYEEIKRTSKKNKI